MKKNDIIAKLTATNEACVNLSQQAESRYAQSKERTDYLIAKKFSTKANYINKLSSMSDKAFTLVAQLKLSESALDAVVQDSYSLEKLKLMLEAIAHNDKSVLSRDDALEQAIAYLASVDFKTVEHFNDLRKALKTKKSNYTESHSTDRQASMICSIFERLNVATRTKKNDKKATQFDTESAFIKRLNKLYE